MKIIAAIIAGALIGSAITAWSLGRADSRDTAPEPGSSADATDSLARAEGSESSAQARARKTVDVGEIAASGSRVLAEIQRGPDISARECLRRVEEAKLALQTEVSSLRQRLDEADDDSPHSRTYDLSQEELAQLAAKCELRWDMPSVSTDGATSISAEDARALGLSADEVSAAAAVFEKHNASMIKQLRSLYTATTGELNASTMSGQSLISEVRDKSAPSELALAFQRLSAERAGLVSAPARGEERPLVEQLYRHLSSAGDGVEHSLAQRIGADKARALRALHGGFSTKNSSSYGCP